MRSRREKAEYLLCEIGEIDDKLLAEASDKDALRAVSEVLLRSMMKAKYSPAPSLHYGLALDYYSHFTSPIRRASCASARRRSASIGILSRISSPWVWHPL